MISVITPVFNGQRFIESCIKVVIEQKCSKVEHVIIDGGSTDGTADVIRQYVSNYPHIRWVSEKDRGQSDAMNKGIAMARGEIIGFLNVDDYYEPDVLNRVVEVFGTLPEPSLVVGNCNVWNNDGKLWWVNKPTKLRLADLLLGSSVHPVPMNPSAYFYHKSLHDTIGPYDVDDELNMDVDFLLRAVQVAKVEYYDEMWGNFSLIEGTKTLSDMQNGQARGHEERLLKKYRKDLRLPERVRVAFLYSILNSALGSNVRYFSRRPRELPVRLIARLRIAAGANR